MTQPAASRSRLDRVLLLVPQVLLAGAMALMVVVHPNAVRSAVMSPRAILVNALLLAGWLLLSFVVLPRVLRAPIGRSAVLTALALGAIAVLVVPTLHDTRVEEAFPGLEPKTAPTTARGDVLMDAVAPVTTAPDPVRVATGELHGIDHDANGTASVYQRADGSLVVALEDIDVEPGPDYHVYVVGGRDRRSPGDGVELAKLKGNQGTQYYEVPRDVTVGAGDTVLIWCRAFGVPVANATQA